MERKRDAELETSFGSLVRLTLKFEEHKTSPEKRRTGQQIIA